MTTHAVPQRTVPVAQAPVHCPFAQLVPAVQTWLHAPQFAGSFATSTQLVPQGTVADEHDPPSNPLLPALAPEPPLGPASGCEPLACGVQSKSSPHCPGKLRPQLAAANSASKKSTVAETRFDSEKQRRKRIRKLPLKSSEARAAKQRAGHSSVAVRARLRRFRTARVLEGCSAGIDLRVSSRWKRSA